MVASSIRIILKIGRGKAAFKSACSSRSQPEYDALRKPARYIPQLAITDWRMPEMGGAELCHRLKYQPTLAGIPTTLKARVRVWMRRDGVCEDVSKFEELNAAAADNAID
ncbi:hypothetical protein PQQ72_12450 [Paraburkholderia strydomiana]|uniref:hypothetical protein n=1 Tax=Paraburkholderia strydomiana TaxID=1245417 RepID=UPI0038BAFEB6